MIALHVTCLALTHFFIPLKLMWTSCLESVQTNLNRAFVYDFPS